MGISCPLLSLTVGAAMMMLSEETGRNGDIESCYTHIYIIGVVHGWAPDREVACDKILARDVDEDAAELGPRRETSESRSRVVAGDVTHRAWRCGCAREAAQLLSSLSVVSLPALDVSQSAPLPRSLLCLLLSPHRALALLASPLRRSPASRFPVHHGQHDPCPPPAYARSQRPPAQSIQGAARGTMDSGQSAGASPADPFAMLFLLAATRTSVLIPPFPLACRPSPPFLSTSSLKTFAFKSRSNGSDTCHSDQVSSYSVLRQPVTSTPRLRSTASSRARPATHSCTTRLSRVNAEHDSRAGLYEHVRFRHQACRPSSRPPSDPVELTSPHPSPSLSCLPLWDPEPRHISRRNERSLTVAEALALYTHAIHTEGRARSAH